MKIDVNQIIQITIDSILIIFITTISIILYLPENTSQQQVILSLSANPTFYANYIQNPTPQRYCYSKANEYYDIYICQYLNFADEHLFQKIVGPVIIQYSQFDHDTMKFEVITKNVKNKETIIIHNQDVDVNHCFNLQTVKYACVSDSKLIFVVARSHSFPQSLQHGNPIIITRIRAFPKNITLNIFLILFLFILTARYVSRVLKECPHMPQNFIYATPQVLDKRPPLNTTFRTNI
ncbi:hypothetical protein SS50377_20327 [Spironucleus salmonicida]|uniref:Transmembrane protein n=1 Tax=Spironucleus salmonicida TaxID=348837 RepID=A0A9P8S183_9EUKA|nr:hypothetical protein SS50377_20327 [Spironucleus salmonicida]